MEEQGAQRVQRRKEVTLVNRPGFPKLLDDLGVEVKKIIGIIVSISRQLIYQLRSLFQNIPF